jgi:hypothetical protein
MRWLGEMEQAVPTVVFAARSTDDQPLGDDVAVEADAAPLLPKLTGTPTPVNPGRHVFTFKRAGASVVVETVINVGEKNRLIMGRFPSPVSAVPPPAPTRAAPNAPPNAPLGEQHESPSSWPVGPLILAAVGMAGVVGSAGLDITTVSDLHSLENAPCASTGTCSEKDVRSIRTRLLIADIALVAGVAALAGAGLWWWMSHRAAPTLKVSPGGATVGATYRF